MTEQAIENKEEGDMVLQCTSAQEESKTFTHYAGKRNLSIRLKSQVILSDVIRDMLDLNDNIHSYTVVYLRGMASNVVLLFFYFQCTNFLPL